jgi:hypothetical protein
MNALQLALTAGGAVEALLWVLVILVVAYVIVAIIRRF